MEYIAHTAPEKGAEQPLIEHLINTAEAAREFAAPFGAEAAAYRCGLLHDIGKYSLAFQKRIRGANIRVDHSTAGAVEAFALRDGAAALCIAGHHGGIPDLGNRTDSSGTLLARVRSRGGKEIEDYSAFREELTAPPAKTPARFAASKEGGFFYAHMLYSCLVDADWLDTERFMSAGGVERGTGEALGELCIKLDAYVSRWWAAAAPINVRRCAILRELMKAGKRRKGLYTLTVPTGGGKTVGSMAFALRHALENAQRRIIYVIPYTSIPHCVVPRAADIGFFALSVDFCPAAAYTVIGGDGLRNRRQYSFRLGRVTRGFGIRGLYISCFFVAHVRRNDENSLCLRVRNGLNNVKRAVYRL